MNREEPCLFEMVVRRTHLTRHDSPSTPHPFASSCHAFLRVPASRSFRGPLIRKSGGSLQLFGRQVHIPHAHNRPLAAPKHAVSYSRCCTTIRAGRAGVQPRSAKLAVGQLGPMSPSQNPPLGLKFSQVQRTIRSYVVQWQAQAKHILPTCVRVLPTRGWLGWQATLIFDKLRDTGCISQLLYRKVSCDVALHLSFVNWSVLFRTYYHEATHSAPPHIRRAALSDPLSIRLSAI